MTRQSNDPGKGPERFLRNTAILIGLAVVSPAAFAQSTSSKNPAQAQASMSDVFGGEFVLDLPVYLGDIPVGEAPVRIVGEEAVSISGPDLQGILGDMLEGPSAAALDAAASGGMVSIETLRAAGLDLAYDPESISIVVGAGVDEMAMRRLALQGSERNFKPTHEPAMVSAYVNARASQSYDHEAGDFGPFRIDLNGAARLGPLAFESEAYYATDDGFVREGSRVIYDHQPFGLRATAGDIRPETTGFQSSEDLLGVSVTHNIDLTPYGASLRSSGRGAFELTRAADVEIYSNEVLVQNIALPPGRYEIDDLVSDSGLNTVRIIITDETGAREEKTFSLYSDNQVLGEGVLQASLAAGIRSRQGDHDRIYDAEQPVATGFLRYGATDTLTIGANFQADETIQMVGAEATLATGYGLFSAEVAASREENGSEGLAAALEWRLNDIRFTEGDRRPKSMSLRLDYYSDDFAAPGVGRIAPEHDFRVSGGYSQEIGWDIGLGVSGYYEHMRGAGADRYGVFGQLSKSFAAGPSVRVGGGYSGAIGGGEEEFFGFVGLSYDFGAEDSATAAYDTRNNRFTASYRHIEGGHIGAVNAHLNATKDDDGASLYGDAQYIGNRFTAGVSHQAGFRGFLEEVETNTTTLHAATAVVFADGAVALTRPVTSAFAIVETDESLKDATISTSRDEDRVSARSDALGPFVAHGLTGYAEQRVEFDIDPLPVGYSLGEGGVRLYPSHRAGYRITIGSESNITLIGVLLTASGEPVALRTGVMTLQGAEEPEVVPFFTNAEGRLVAQGLKPGRWLLEATGHDGAAELDVPEGADALLRLENIRLQSGDI